MQRVLNFFFITDKRVDDLFEKGSRAMNARILYLLHTLNYTTDLNSSFIGVFHAPCVIKK